MPKGINAIIAQMEENCKSVCADFSRETKRISLYLPDFFCYNI